jgi:hypothetical protein
VSQLPKVEWLNQWRSESDDFRRSKAKIKGLVVFTFSCLNLIHRRCGTNLEKKTFK